MVAQLGRAGGTVRQGSWLSEAGLVAQLGRAGDLVVQEWWRI
jgi:hypothetical protein